MLIFITIALLFTKLHLGFGAPILLEAQIATKESVLKVTKPSIPLLRALEDKFEVSVSEIFELPKFQNVAKLDFNLLEGYEDNNTSKVIIISQDPELNNKYLVAPLALPTNILERLLGDDTGAFLQILLPGYERQTRIPKPQGETTNEVEIMIEREPSPEESLARFLQRFLKIDIHEASQYIPESVRKVLATSQQALVNPKSFLQIPEGQTNDNARIFTITNAVPVKVALGLFEWIL